MSWQNMYVGQMHQNLYPQDVNRQPTLRPFCVINEDDPEYASYSWVGSNFRKQMRHRIQDNMLVSSTADVSETYLNETSRPMSDANKIQDTSPVSETGSIDIIFPSKGDPIPMVINPVVGKHRKDKFLKNRKSKPGGQRSPTKIIFVQDSVIAASMKKLQNEDMATTMKLLYLEGPLSNSEIRDKSDLSSSSINHALTRLQESDLVLRVGRNYYITSYGKILVDGVMFILDSIEAQASKIGFEMRSIQP